MLARCLRSRYIGLALGIAVMLGCFPNGVQAKMVGSMASDAQQLTGRQAREAQVARLLSEEKVAQALGKLNLTPEQVKEHLTQLSDDQLEQLAQNLQTIQSGKSAGIVLMLLAIVLLGVLIYMQIEAV